MVGGVVQGLHGRGCCPRLHGRGVVHDNMVGGVVHDYMVEEPIIFYTCAQRRKAI